MASSSRSAAEHETGGGGGDSEEDVQHFFEEWTQKQKQHLQELVTAAEQLSGSSPDSSPPPPQPQNSPDPNLLIQDMVEICEEYHRAKSDLADRNVLLMLSAPWNSSLEDAYFWIGGWRPTMAVQLLYSKSGLQLAAKLDDLIGGVLTTHDLADLSPRQMNRIDELHRRIIKEEKEITEKMAKQQERATDPDIVELSHLMSDAMRGEKQGKSVRDREAEREQVKTTLIPKEEGLRKNFEKAADLRMRTLKSIIDILSPLQGIHFLIAAFELLLRLHEWGMAKDGRKQPNSDPPQGGVGGSIFPEAT